jgi:hypothetical protein
MTGASIELTHALGARHLGHEREKMSGNAPFRTLLIALRPSPSKSLIAWMPFRSSNTRTLAQSAFPGTCIRTFPRSLPFRSSLSVSSSCLRPTRFIHLSSSKAADTRSPPPDEKLSAPTSSDSDLKSEYSSPSKRAYSAQDETPEDSYERRNDSSAPQPFLPPAASSGGSSLPLFAPIAKSPTFDAALTTALGLVIGEHLNARRPLRSRVMLNVLDLSVHLRSCLSLLV